MGFDWGTANGFRFDEEPRVPDWGEWICVGYMEDRVYDVGAKEDRPGSVVNSERAKGRMSATWQKTLAYVHSDRTHGNLSRRELMYW